MNQLILFGADIQLNKLTKPGDPLEKAIRKPNYDKGGRLRYLKTSSLISLWKKQKTE